MTTILYYLIGAIALVLLYTAYMAIFAEVDPSEPDFRPDKQSLFKHIFKPSKDRYTEDEL